MSEHDTNFWVLFLMNFVYAMVIIWFLFDLNDRSIMIEGKIDQLKTDFTVIPHPSGWTGSINGDKEPDK